MPVFTTEGIIIKRSNYGEADRILTIVTPYKGKIHAIAKGVRRITSRKGGNVEALNKVKIQIFQGKGLGIVTEVQAEETFPKTKNDLMLSSYASHIIELADRLLPEQQLNPAAYNLLVVALTLLETNSRQIFIRAFEIKLLTVLGFWSADQVSTTDEIQQILQQLQRKTWEEIEDMKLSANQATELERILRHYLEKVIEGPLRSVKIIQQLKG